MNIAIDILLLSLISISAYNVGASRAYGKGYKRGIADMKLVRKWEKDNKEREAE
jgi:hypothetical protein